MPPNEAFSRSSGNISVCAGITSAIRGTYNRHNILNWQYRDSFSPITADAAPEPGTIALLLVAGVPAVGLIRRRKSRHSKTTASA